MSLDIKVDVKSLLEAGVHFGHKTRRWNPKMAPYIFGTKEKIHIIDLDRTYSMMCEALKVAHDVAADGGRILFVGTKRQSCDRVAAAAAKCGQYYVNHRWLGGMLTNWKTISQSIKKLENLEKRLKDTEIILKKKERLVLQKKLDKLNKALGGVRNMGGTPALLFVLDTIEDRTAVEEARVLGIPVIGICDTNSDPTIVDFPIPGNDDSVRAIDLYCSVMEDAIVSGIQTGLAKAGVDLGSLDRPVTENVGKRSDSRNARREKQQESKTNDADKNQ